MSDLPEKIYIRSNVGFVRKTWSEKKGNGRDQEYIRADIHEEIQTAFSDVMGAFPQWQPIESAPKDGTLILMLEKNGRIQVSKWTSDSDGYNYDWYVQLTQCGPKDTYPTHGVTHWMPLPKAPT